MFIRKQALPTAWLNLRYSINERIEIFRKGLERLGYTVKIGLPAGGDLLVTWNRIGHADTVAKNFGSVFVAENSAWGNGFLGGQWLSLARDRHNTSGMFPIGGSDRWDCLGVDLGPWRTEGETVLLPQRGIGSPPTAMPRHWPQDAQARHGGRIRPHPGQGMFKPLREDLSSCGRVITWGSGAAIQALMLGIPVVSEMPDWIGEQDNTDSGRLEMFRRLAWAQWRHDEIRSGEAIARLLK
jgi:hypothetical protein